MPPQIWLRLPSLLCAFVNRHNSSRTLSLKFHNGMAAAIATLAPPEPPLHERTNSHPDTHMAMARSYERMPPVTKMVRRTESVRQIRKTSDSYGSPLEDDSIYNADALSSGELSPSQEKDAWQMPTSDKLSSATNPDSEHAVLQFSPPLAPRSPPQGHSNWPAPLLHTILERQSTRSLRRSLSAPRLRQSLERSPNVVKLQGSIRSLRPVRSHRSP